MFSQLWKDFQEYKKLNENSNKSTMWILAHRDYAQIMALHRLREKMNFMGLSLANHILRRTQSSIYGIEIGKNVSVGTGTRFIHPVGITIGGDSRIGDRVTFLGGNTVGTSNENGYPFIENDVTIGAGARIIGPVTIGSGSIIGANSMVNKSTSNGSISVGIPARSLQK